MSGVSVWPIEPGSYVSHPLHAEACAWIEKNCYVDVWIEVLHAQALDPMAILPFTLAMDFEGDQWTFFKPPADDLEELYGISVQELTVWRPIMLHAAHHVAEGKLVFTEADAFFLPDTRGTDYRTNHTKTTIAIQAIDVAGRQLGYFHNAGYHVLEGTDFDDLFRLKLPNDPSFLPLFAELVRIDRIRRLKPQALRSKSLELLQKHLKRKPDSNPISRFRNRFASDLEEIKAAGLAVYHAYAFASLRQFGAGFELASLYLRWLDANDKHGFMAAAEDFQNIALTAKALILKGARAVSAGKNVDFTDMMDTMERSWDTAMALLERHFSLGRISSRLA